MVSDPHTAFSCFLRCATEYAEFWAKGLVEQLSYINKNVLGDLWIAKSNVMSYADVALYYLLYVFGRENKEAVEAALATAPKVSARTTHSQLRQRWMQSIEQQRRGCARMSLCPRAIDRLTFVCGRLPPYVCV